MLEANKSVVGCRVGQALIGKLILVLIEYLLHISGAVNHFSVLPCGTRPTREYGNPPFLYCA